MDGYQTAKVRKDGDGMKEREQVYFSNDDKIKAFDKIAERYFRQNFGTLSKTDIDQLMFSILRDSGKDGNKKPINTDDYGLSKLLGISQTRVRSLKQSVQLKFPVEDENWKRIFASLIENARYDDIKKLVKMSIPDVNVLIEIRHLIEVSGWYDEYQLNPKLFQCPLDVFIKLCESLEEEKVQINEETKKKLRELSDKHATDGNKTAFEKLLAGDFKNGIKEFAIEASKEVLCEVLNLIPFAGFTKKAINSLCYAIQRT